MKTETRQKLFDYFAQEHGISLMDSDYNELEAVAHDAERFIRPTAKQLIEISILFNNGNLQKKKLTDMLSVLTFVIDRLYENGDVSKPTKDEHLKPNQPEKGGEK